MFDFSTNNDQIREEFKVKKLSNGWRQSTAADDDSVCADIDRWADSSLGSNSMSECRIKELEEERQKLADSLIALSTHFARVQFRIQQIGQAPIDKREEMIRELQELASSSCLDMSQLKTELTEEYTGQKPDGHMSELITQLRQQLEELEQFAFKNGQLPTGELPLRVLHQRQNLVLKKLQEKIPSLKIEFEKPTASHDHFMELVERDFEQGMEPLREKDKLLDQLRTQITDLERFVKLLQAEIGSPPPSPIERKKEEEITNRVPPTTSAESDDIRPLDLRKPIDQMKSQQKDACKKSSFFGHFIGHGFSRKHFERNELKHTTMGNHYGDQRAELEIAVHEVVETLNKNQILSIERPERDELSVEKLNECAFECSQPESVISVIRKRFCPTLRALLEHGMRESVVPTQSGSTFSLLSGISRFTGGRNVQVNSKYLRPELRKFDGYKIEHIWDVIQLFFELSRALEMRDAIIGSLSDAFKLESIDGKTATSKQILLCTIENVMNSHTRLKRSPDSMWKAFVCASLNRNRLPAWIRIIFRSDLVFKKCYNDWSYVARTGCEDIRQLLEKLHEFNFDLPVDLAVRPFEHIKEAF